MIVTEGTWLDFVGNPFGVGQLSTYRQKDGRYQNWKRPDEPSALFENEDYAVMHLGDYQGKWNSHFDGRSYPLVCQKPLESKFITFDEYEF